MNARHLAAGGGVALGFAALFSGVGAVKATVLLVGGAAAIPVLWHPVLGLVYLIFLSTCLQLLGISAVTGLPFSLVKIAGLLTLGAWTLQAIRSRPAFTVSSQNAAIAAFFLAVVLSAAVQPDVIWSLDGLFRLVQVVILYFLIANIAGESRRRALLVCAALTAAMAASGVIGLLEFTLPQFAVESNDPRLAAGTIGAVMDRESLLSGTAFKRITGGVGDANSLAYTLAATMPLFIFWWRHAPGTWLRLLATLALGLQLAALFLTYTRTGFIGLACAVLFLFIKGRLPRLRLAAFTAAAIIAGVAVMPASFAERMLSKGYLKEGSTPSRRDLMLGAWELIKERPLLGHGFGQFGPRFMAMTETAPFITSGIWEGHRLELESGESTEDVKNIGEHNLILAIGVQYGLLGLLPFLAFLTSILRDLREAERHGDPVLCDLAVCLGAGAVGFFATSMLHHLWSLKILWILAGLAAAVRRLALIPALAEATSGRG